MKLFTFGEAAQKVRSELDLQEETFIGPDELVGYFNDAIHEAESEILKINEDYLLSYTTLSMVTGESLIDLPANIYAQKIRALIYINGSTQYSVKRIRGANKFDILTQIQQYGTSDDYRYIPINQTAGQQSKIQLVPTSREDGDYLTLWFIRSANRIPTAAELGTAPTDSNTDAQNNTVLDLPEAANFIFEFVKRKCLPKDGDPRVAEQDVVTERQRALMIETLTDQVPDDDDTILPDMDFYVSTS